MLEHQLDARVTADLASCPRLAPVIAGRPDEGILSRRPKSPDAITKITDSLDQLLASGGCRTGRLVHLRINPMGGRPAPRRPGPADWQRRHPPGRMSGVAWRCRIEPPVRGGFDARLERRAEGTEESFCAAAPLTPERSSWLQDVASPAAPSGPQVVGEHGQDEAEDQGAGEQ